jgi:uncharacterized protein with FMN-binding domain
MKKTTLSFWFIATSVAYVAYLYFTGPVDVAPSVASSTPTSSASAPASVLAATSNVTGQSSAGSSPNTGDPIALTSTTISMLVTPTPVKKSSGQYVDGTYTGSSESAYYGTVQVDAVIQGGKLAGVDFLQYPNDRRTSQSINNRAMAALKSEAIQSQSASVSVVSGATDTSTAFQQSLANALSQAKA